MRRVLQRDGVHIRQEDGIPRTFFFTAGVLPVEQTCCLPREASRVPAGTALRIQSFAHRDQNGLAPRLGDVLPKIWTNAAGRVCKRMVLRRNLR